MSDAGTQPFGRVRHSEVIRGGLAGLDHPEPFWLPPSGVCSLISGAPGWRIPVSPMLAHSHPAGFATLKLFVVNSPATVLRQKQCLDGTRPDFLVFFGGRPSVPNPARPLMASHGDAELECIACPC